MSKTVLPSKFQELKGLDRISTVVHEMHCLFREISKDDVGLDGEIEVLAPKPDGLGFTTTGGIVKVQAKSGLSFVVQDTATSFATPVKRPDLEYWHSATFPVLFIVYHPGEDRLYYKEVQSYIRAMPLIWQPPHRIVFDKAADEFGLASKDQVAELACDSPPSRISFQQKERLFSNLFLVKRMPRMLTHAPTEHKDARQVRLQIKGYVPPYCIVDGQLYTLSDLRDPRCVLRDFCDPTHIGETLVEQWLKDPDRRRDYVYMLNRLFSNHLYRCGVKHHAHYKRHYLPRKDEESLEFKQDWYNVRTSRNAPPRITAKHYEYGLDAFWRHLAAVFTFKQFGNAWFLQVIPKYMVTTDGREPYDPDRTGPLITKLKARERNPHVLNHVLFWADVLSQHSPTIQVQLDGRTATVIERAPYSGVAGFAIPDDPAIFEEPPEAEQGTFLDILFGTPGDDEEDAEQVDVKGAEGDDEY